MDRHERARLILSENAIKPLAACVGCDSVLLDTIVDLGTQSVVDFVDSPDELVLKAPLRLRLCNSCGLVQLSHSVAPDLLYRDFWYRSGINESMKLELNDITDCAALSANLRIGDSVLDIGCNDGTLLASYPKHIKTFGIDPCNVTSEAKADHIEVDYFTPESAGRLYAHNGMKGFCVITAIAMFYDLLRPLEFLEACKLILADEGVLIIQMNYLLGMILNTAFDNICHEHVAYYSLTALKALADKAGFFIEDVTQNDVNGGSFRVYLRKDGFISSSTSRVSDMLLCEQKLLTRKAFHSFADRIEIYKNKINNALSCIFESGRPTFAYGASTRGSTLLQTLGCSKYLMGAAERDSRKFGKMTAGSWLRIFPETNCREAADVFLCLPYHFKDSILAREDFWLSCGDHKSFIFPLPEPTLVTFKGERKL